MRLRRTGFRLLAALAVLLPALAARAVEDAVPEGADPALLLDRAFKNLYAEDYVQAMRLETLPRSGRGMTRLIQITRRQSVLPGKALIRFLEPYQVRRTSILILENDGASDDLYVYLPATGLTRHLSSSQRADSFFGTDLCYEDIEPKVAADYRVSRTGSDAFAGLPCIRLDIRSQEGFESTYEKMISCVEEERGVILWTEFHRRGALVKRLEIDPASIQKIGERFVPFTMTMADLRRGSQTTIRTERYDIRPGIPDQLFSTWNLEAGDAARDERASRVRRD